MKPIKRHRIFVEDRERRQFAATNTLRITNLCCLLFLGIVTVATAPSGAQSLDDSRWLSLGVQGRFDDVAVMILSRSGDLYVGGNFARQMGVEADAIAEWTGSSWSALGSGLRGQFGDEGFFGPRVTGLALDGGGSLYVGGDFGTAGGITANGIVKWDGHAWSALAPGISELGPLICDTNGILFASGSVRTAYNVLTMGVARQNGGSWSLLGAGMNSWVNALALDRSGNLYAGGSFSIAGGVNANCVAKWNGQAWSPLGSGMDGYVRALAFDSNGDLYAGGAFTIAGGVSATNVAKWNGSTWSAVGAGLNDYVTSLACDGFGNLFAGGGFTAAGQVTASHIAKWNGRAWFALGSGTDRWVGTLIIEESGNLYVGGSFNKAGTNVSPGLARYLLREPAYNRLSLQSLGTGTNLITFLGTPGENYALDMVNSLRPPLNWTPLRTNTAATADAVSAGYLILTNAIASPQAYYRLRHVP